MRIVRHNQMTLLPENPVIGNFEHPEPAPHEGHGFQVIAQRRHVLAGDALFAIRSDQRAIQPGNLFKLAGAELDTGRHRLRHSQHK